MNEAPKHIAIIMDGNGRWAKNNHQPRIFGHKEGVRRVNEIVEFCATDTNIKILTLYTFSFENWLRPKKEIDSLMSLQQDVGDKIFEYSVFNQNFTPTREQQPEYTNDDNF